MNNYYIMIKIKNIYHMLAYAFSILREDTYKNIACEDFEYVADLFAAILSKGISNQIRRGLGKDYIMKNELLYYPRGKINVSDSIKYNSLINKQLVCEIEEFEENIYINKILKATILLLIKSNDVNKIRKNSLKKILYYFNHVDTIAINKIQWNAIQYHKNNATYKMLLHMSYFVINGMLLTQEKGVYTLAHYVDDQHMHKLFERFVKAYYQKHFPQYNPQSTHIAWNIQEGNQELLPLMISDITLQFNNKTLIIDTKYYSSILKTHSQFNTQSLNSANLYQIYTYVKNFDVNQTGNVYGLLLYASTDEQINPKTDVVIGGNKISVKTLNLNTEFSYIAYQLDTIVKDYLSIK